MSFSYDRLEDVLPGILDRVNQPNDIKKLSEKEYAPLAAEIRRFLVMNVSKTGGHLASNLGVVELTMALHLWMDFPNDKLVWDVGHQSYVHKILTGRKKEFPTLRQYQGMSGFPKRKESDCDAFDTGHSSTSISIANGLAKARDLAKEKRKVVAVIGDGALSGGMAYEALNNISRMKTNLMIVLNDNNMSIAENVGGMASYLGKVRTNTAYTGFKGRLERFLKGIPGIGEVILNKLKKSKESIKHLFIPGMLFEDMGLTYIGPVDGHNISQMLTAFESASKVKGSVIVHVITKKGKGYEKAELDPCKYHGVEPFDLKTGNSLEQKKRTFTEIFSETMLEWFRKDSKLVAITAAMPAGTGLNRIAARYPKRCFDVGIAEEHAVTFAAGLAAGGFHPVVAVYSTFLQRAYDQILHDVCIGGLKVIFAIDRAGIVGNDGETHQGIFDLSYLSHIPGLTVMAPGSGKELKMMLDFSMALDKPVAIRYPRGSAYERNQEPERIVYGKSEVIFETSANDLDVCLFAVGVMAEAAIKAGKCLERKGYQVAVINVRFVSPMDQETIRLFASRSKIVVTAEENVACGGFGEQVAAFLEKCQIKQPKFLAVSIPDIFLPHGDIEQLRKDCGLTAEQIAEAIQKLYQEG